MTDDGNREAARLEAAADEARRSQYRLRLYVTGAARRSLRATERVKRFCETFLPERHSLDVVDLYERPDLARSAGILGAPTLVKEYPKPLCRLVGDMRDEGRMLRMLGIEPSPTAGG